MLTIAQKLFFFWPRILYDRVLVSRCNLNGPITSFFASQMPVSLFCLYLSRLYGRCCLLKTWLRRRHDMNSYPICNLPRETTAHAITLFLRIIRHLQIQIVLPVTGSLIQIDVSLIVVRCVCHVTQSGLTSLWRIHRPHFLGVMQWFETMVFTTIGPVKMIALARTYSRTSKKGIYMMRIYWGIRVSTGICDLQCNHIICTV